MIDNDQSIYSAPLKQILNEAFDYYIEHKDSIDSDVQGTLSYAYKAID